MHDLFSLGEVQSSGRGSPGKVIWCGGLKCWKSASSKYSEHENFTVAARSSAPFETAEVEVTNTEEAVQNDLHSCSWV